MKPYKFTLTALFIYLAGLLLGGLVGYHIGVAKSRRPRSPQEFRKYLFQKLDNCLDLSTDQKKKLDCILDENFKDGIMMMREVKPKILAIMQKEHNQIEAILTPEQKKNFKVFIAQRMQKFNRAFSEETPRCDRRH
ncbi:hypothetical protein P0136_08005 [Lentisphaerota bacterium ZTH]|nr:hypothetical protein JYG24_00885 [Lentisphaerota bacterium]WET05307.1 hypothetical protein P0136_08005 [Lentisphaerota bacterium ZTH]